MKTLSKRVWQTYLKFTLFIAPWLETKNCDVYMCITKDFSVRNWRNVKKDELDF